MLSLFLEIVATCSIGNEHWHSNAPKTRVPFVSTQIQTGISDSTPDLDSWRVNSRRSIRIEIFALAREHRGKSSWRILIPD